MDTSRLERVSEYEWRLPARGAMRVPGVLYADRELLEDMDDKVIEQLANVATLPGIVSAAYAMPDAHWGYGFPIGGVAAFDPQAGGVVSAGGVGFDISCGVRALATNLSLDQVRGEQQRLATTLYHRIPAGMGSTGAIELTIPQLDEMLAGGARWAVEEGYGGPADLELIEEQGCAAGADPAQVSIRAKNRQRAEMGTLGSGNHYLELQRVSHVYDPELAARAGLAEDDVLLSVHCGSRGLGHQIGSEFLREMAARASDYGLSLPDRELACAPIESELGQRYLGAMRAGINCALANRQIITELARRAVREVFPDARLDLLYDVSHNTCKEETHEVDGAPRRLFVHRKGATRALGPGHPGLCRRWRDIGQPVLIGGSMGTASHLMLGSGTSEARAFSSACHGAGRAMSRNQAARRWRGETLREELAGAGILVKCRSSRGIAEEAPGAYKDVDEVVAAAEHAGLAHRVVRLEPLIVVKG